MINIHQWDDFTIMSYDLCEMLPIQCNWGNYDAEDYVKARLRKENPKLYKRLDFDSEMGCFFAYAKKLEDAEALVEFLNGLMNNKKKKGGKMATTTKLPRNFEQRVQKLRAKGASQETIAAKLNVTRWQVRKALGAT